jgi:5'-3' exonuclease
MGVPGLLGSDLVALYKCLISLRKKSGKKIQVDANALLYLFVYGKFPHNRYEFMFRARFVLNVFRQLKIYNVWIFEGKSPPWKEGERIKRAADRKRKTEHKEEIEEKFHTTKRQRQTVETVLEQLQDTIATYDQRMDEEKKVNEYKETPIVEESAPLVTVHILINENLDEMMDEYQPGEEYDFDFIQIQIEIEATVALAEEKKEMMMVVSGDGGEEPRTLDTLTLEELEKMYQEYSEQLGEVKFQESKQSVEYEKANLNNSRPTREDIATFKEFLTLNDVPWIQAEYEADYVFENLGFDVLAQDSDTLWHGCNLLSYEKLAQITDDKTVNEYAIAPILKHARLTLKQFKEVCFLSGNDYTSGIYGLSITKAYDLMMDPECGGSLHNICNYLIQKAQTTITKISKMKTAGSEANQKKLAKARKDITGIKEFVEFYDFVHDKLVDKNVYNIKWTNFDVPVDSDAVNAFIATQRGLTESRMMIE